MCTLRGPTMYDANENCSVKIVHLENLGFVFSKMSLYLYFYCETLELDLFPIRLD